ncbi:ADGRL2 [Branchiostoma lanceolatum]|uniref:ADGRL2 protein n=1 Tax=Branchiostoma lanceolatum TaxID=7740 RepID=A0A8K0EVG2_BRALA|nr:ADGRL2 [Branchiostoma lanceolatum]
MSLTRLFNFDVDESGENNPNQCPSDAVYDPFVDTCRHFSSASRSHGSSYKTIPLQNCSKPALIFTSEEFSVLPNGSVHLLSSNVSCPAAQVVILNTTASICGECILQYFSNNTQITISLDPVQGWLTLGLVIVSIVAVFGFVVHTVWSGQWKKVPEKLKVQMMICMVTAEFMFVVRVYVPSGPGCTTYAILLQYVLLTAFTSMNALSLDLFLTFRDGLERMEMYKYLLYTWLVPVLVVVPTIIVEFGSSVRVGYGESCWIGNPTASLVAFGVPVFCSLLVNAALVTFVLLAIRKSFQIADAANSRSQSSKAWVYLRISFLTGITWLLGFIYPYVNSRVIDYIFIVLNASQGLLLTVALTMTSKVVQKWKSAIRARLDLGEPHQDQRRTAAASNQQSNAGGTEATAVGTGSTTDMPMATLADVQENGARLQMYEIHQGRGHGITASASNLQNTADGTEATAVGTGSTTEMLGAPMATLADVEENGARLQMDEGHRGSGRTATASIRQATSGGNVATAVGTGSATKINVTTLADVQENGARLQQDEAHQDQRRTAAASNQQKTTNGTKAAADRTGPATEVPMATLANMKKNNPREYEKETRF